MKPLNPLGLDPLTVFKEIATVKHNERKIRLLTLCQSLQTRFIEYETCKLELSKMSASQFKNRHQADLTHCYEVKTQPLDKLLSNIKIMQPFDLRHKCQFCGIDSPTTWDHYLPKSQFPEFSVHPLNLIPCCSTCNEKKGDAFLLKGEREIVNLYFDYIPTDEQYLFIEITYYKDVPYAEYKLIKPDGLSQSIFDLIKRHYERLNLLTRYRENSPEVFSETKSTIMTHVKTNRSKLIKDWLIDETERLKNRFSVNHWKAVLHEGMSRSQEYISSCLI